MMLDEKVQVVDKSLWSAGVIITIKFYNEVTFTYTFTYTTK